ncbi:right-handed parallel beta-helix repeat-containing protein [Desertimonas flava]|uniref:right-handed parallel beta-helix repeat-containing protein n=1 Tax=Desertimonas flava TaxID=2064846 RepID=UPI000E34ED17|nr:right-handed parallel beta-helix repeat-containing protein [Desertimonas flava]
MNKRWVRGLAAVSLLAVVGGAHPGASASTEVPEGGGAVLAVPADFPTIQEAVDAAQPGDLVLISPGTYHEAVNVVTPEITIRGLDRNEVILDGQFELDNGIRVLGAPGVAVENMTAMNYAYNGFFWTGVDGYRGSYLTSYRTGDYGIYAFDSTHGQLEHSYAAGSPDAGVYIGQCYPCDAVIDDVIAEHNGLGYSGTNSGGNLLIVNSRFNNNRAGIVPNSGSYELCYPERETTIVGNLVYSNNQPDTPAIDVAILAMGNGIVIAGGVGNVVSNNRIWDHDKTGIGLVPFLEEGAADDIPSPDDDDRPCEDTKNDPINTSPPTEPLIWNSRDNVVTDNVLSDNRTADIGIGVADAPEAAADLDNCFAGNELTVTAPADLETLAPCDGEGDGDWAAEPLDVVSWLVEAETRPPSVPYDEAELPELPELEGMPDAETAPADPATDMPRAVDLDAIETPAAPDGTAGSEPATSEGAASEAPATTG